MKKVLRFLKLIGLPLLIAIGIYSFIRFVWLADDKKEFEFVQINTQDYLNLYYDSEESIVFVIKDDTDKKSEYEQIIREKFDGKQITVYYYNITNISEAELTDFKSATGLKKDYELPLLIYTLKGNVYDYLEDYQEPHYVVEFIERNNIG